MSLLTPTIREKFSIKGIDLLCTYLYKLCKWSNRMALFINRVVLRSGNTTYVDDDFLY